MNRSQPLKKCPQTELLPIIIPKNPDKRHRQIPHPARIKRRDIIAPVQHQPHIALLKKHHRFLNRVFIIVCIRNQTDQMRFSHGIEPPLSD